MVRQQRIAAEMKPLAVDLFCGLGGWAEGFLAAGYDVVGFDNTRHRYPSRAVPESDGRKAPHARRNRNGLSGARRAAAKRGKIMAEVESRCRRRRPMNLLTQEPQPDPSYRLITLTKGQTAVVDAIDYEWLMQWKWHAKKGNHSDGYYACRTKHPNRTTVRMHRSIMGDPVGVQIDHRDGNTLNNRRSNLRRATQAQNQYNRSTQKNNVSGIKGIAQRDGRWVARINVNKKTIHLGRFGTKEEATAVRAKAALKYHGEFAR